MKNKEKLVIFYADDDPDDRYLFEAALAQWDQPYELFVYNNGLALEEALAAKDYDCDLVFLDLNMPVKDGLQTLSALQNAIRQKGLKVVIFTTSGNQSDIRHTFELNAIRYVQKPNDFGLLEKVVARVVAQTGEFSLPVAFQSYQL